MIRIPKPNNWLAHLAGVLVFLGFSIAFLLDGSLVLDLEPARGLTHLTVGTVAMAAAWISLREIYTPRR